MSTFDSDLQMALLLSQEEGEYDIDNHDQNVKTDGTKVFILPFIDGSCRSSSQFSKFDPITKNLTIWGGKKGKREFVVKNIKSSVTVKGVQHHNRCLECALAYHLDGYDLSREELVLYLNRDINDGNSVPNRMGDCSNIIRFVELYGIDVYVQNSTTRNQGGVAYCLGPKLRVDHCIYIISYPQHFLPYVEIK